MKEEKAQSKEMTEMAMPNHGTRPRKAARQLEHQQDETVAMPMHGTKDRKKKDPEAFHGGK